jgi:hypothetical protein
MGTTKVRLLNPAVANALGIEGDEGTVNADTDLVEQAIELGAVERVGRAPSSDAPKPAAKRKTTTRKRKTAARKS